MCKFILFQFKATKMKKKSVSSSQTKRKILDCTLETTGKLVCRLTGVCIINFDSSTIDVEEEQNLDMRLVAADLY